MTVAEEGTAAPAPIVIDNNVVLDLLVFSDPATSVLKDQLAAGRWRWIATRSMRDELAAVLQYPHMQRVMAARGIAPDQVLAAVDAGVQWQEPAPKAVVTCKDKDDQKFIDLAVAHGAMLLSKDKAVLCMRKRLLTLGVIVQAALK
ncbi:putative toxin-antitoxin system toxin component, PIN family [Curvibacter sp. APW13]|uniref:putative toxin-antitoxin system toxin component, PIN family n=1 Tax=Curvibacter sp. APW13 TaxID=3077236 RepID=UPI0028DDD0B4|nr:putative toxin-antitoxin system toxin component, PIN family [Curvibacter sp. APW13]MDT8990840.1 putative toxin-antitoxin system toxin component, PIN family [Curvibacter sp. APW13]